MHTIGMDTKSVTSRNSEKQSVTDVIRLLFPSKEKRQKFHQLRAELPGYQKRESIRLTDGRQSISGFDRAVNKKTSILERLFWLLVLLFAIAGLLFTITQRVSHYQKSTQNTHYASTTEHADFEGLHLPSFSVCSKGYNTEFIYFDVAFKLIRRIEYYFEHPLAVLQKVLNNRGKSLYFRQNFFVEFAQAIINIYHQRRLKDDSQLNFVQLCQKINFNFKKLNIKGSANLCPNLNNLTKIDNVILINDFQFKHLPPSVSRTLLKEELDAWPTWQLDFEKLVFLYAANDVNKLFQVKMFNNHTLLMNQLDRVFSLLRTPPPI